MIITVNGTDLKKCSGTFGCGKYKELKEFYKSNGSSDGYQYKCKQCAILYSKLRYESLATGKTVLELFKENTGGQHE